jgi:hypothetical protein
MKPEMIGRYEIQSEIGRGGMASVYLAYDPRFRRKVAIKLVSVNLQENPLFISRFEREAHLIARIEHPAIVPVYDFGEQDQQPYLVMRYMAGGSLADKMNGQTLSLEEASRIISQLANALDAVHAQGIVHRDLKPGNILFDDFGNAAIADFGIAHLSEATVDLTGSALIGTPTYMSPEQVQGERELDGRSDVYSLGILLFEMLTGQGPFKATTPMSVALKHLTDPVPPILSIRPDLPLGLEPVLNKALEKDRNLRYASATDMASDLRAVVGNLPQQDAKPEQPPATPAVAIPAAIPAIQPRPAITGARPPKPAPRAASPVSVLIKIASVAGIVLIIFGLCGLGVLFLAWLGSASSGITVTQPSADVLPTADYTSSPAATEIVLLEEDFSDPDSGWPSYEDALGAYSYQPDGYRISVKTPNTALWATTNEVFDNATIAVDASPLADTDGYYGLLCRVNNLNEYYYFIVHPDGSYSAGKYLDNEFEILIADGWQYTSSINLGAQTNRLRADCHENTLRFYINDILLAEITDYAFTSGSGGLIVATLEVDVFEVTFKNLRVTQPVP